MRSDYCINIDGFSIKPSDVGLTNKRTLAAYLTLYQVYKGDKTMSLDPGESNESKEEFKNFIKDKRSKVFTDVITSSIASVSNDVNKYNVQTLLTLPEQLTKEALDIAGVRPEANSKIERQKACNTDMVNYIYRRDLSNTIFRTFVDMINDYCKEHPALTRMEAIKGLGGVQGIFGKIKTDLIVSILTGPTGKQADYFRRLARATAERSNGRYSEEALYNHLAQKLKQDYVKLVNNFTVLSEDACKNIMFAENIYIDTDNDRVSKIETANVEDTDANIDDPYEMKDDDDRMSQKEGWMLNYNEKSAHSTTSIEVLRMLSNIKKVNINGQYDTDYRGEYRNVDPSHAHSVLLNAFASIIDSKDVLPKLNELRVQYRWVDQIIQQITVPTEKLPDESEEEFHDRQNAAQKLFSLFYKDMNKALILYLSERFERSKDGTITAKIQNLNKPENVRYLYDRWRDNYQNGFLQTISDYSIYDEKGTINPLNAKKIHELLDKLENLYFTVGNTVKEGKNAAVTQELLDKRANYVRTNEHFKASLINAARSLGCDVTEETLEGIIAETKMRQEPTKKGRTSYEPIAAIIYWANEIANTVYKNATNSKDETNVNYYIEHPIDLINSFGKPYNRLAELFGADSDEHIESSIYENGKGVWAHVKDNYIFRLKNILKNVNPNKEVPEAFRATQTDWDNHKYATYLEYYIGENYRKYEWFYSDSKYNFELIEDLLNDEEFRNEFDVQIVFDQKDPDGSSKKEAKDWGVKEALLSQLAEFNYASGDKEREGKLARYHLPLPAEAGFAYVMTLRRYGDEKDSLGNVTRPFEDIIADKFVKVIRQEYNRIMDVRKRDELMRNGTMDKSKFTLYFDITRKEDGSIDESVANGASFKFLPELNSFKTEEIVKDKSEIQQAKDQGYYDDNYIVFLINKGKNNAIDAQELQRNLHEIAKQVLETNFAKERKFYKDNGLTEITKSGKNAVLGTDSGVLHNLNTIGEFLRYFQIQGVNSVIAQGLVTAHFDRIKKAIEATTGHTKDGTSYSGIFTRNLTTADLPTVFTTFLDSIADVGRFTQNKKGLYVLKEGLDFTTFDERVINTLASTVRDITRTINDPTLSAKINQPSPTDRALKEFYFNFCFAQSQMIELITGDLAYYPSLEEWIKRAKQYHAPVDRMDIYATWNGERVSDGYQRIFFAQDTVSRSNVYEDVVNILATKDNLTAAEKTVIGGKYLQVNATDGQAYRTLKSIRDVMIMKGAWEKEKAEKSYQNILNGTWSMLDFDFLVTAIKPYIYTSITQTWADENGQNHNLKQYIQIKDSEAALLTMYGAISEVNTSSRMSGINKFMTDHNIDVMVFESAVKVGKSGVIDLNYRNIRPTNNYTYTIDDTKVDVPVEEVTIGGNNYLINSVQGNKIGETYGLISLLDQLVNSGKISEVEYRRVMDNFSLEDEEETVNRLESTLLNNDGSYNYDTIHEISYEDYGEQTPNPEHTVDAFQLFGTQLRKLITADTEPGTIMQLPGVHANMTIMGTPRGNKEGELTFKDLLDFYNELNTENILDAFRNLSEEFNNIDKVAELLRETIKNSATFSPDLLDACTLVVEPNGFKHFNLPLCDNIQSRKIQQLLSSILKNNITKQKIKGGSCVQVSNFSYSRQLNIRFKNAKGELILNEKEFETSQYKQKYKTFEAYKASLDGKTVRGKSGIAYVEAYCNCYDSRLMKFLNKADKKDGILKVENIPAPVRDEICQCIGYRIPTEDKFSMLPIKIVGFLPPNMSSTIMLPADWTTISGSDFDIDHLYMMFPELQTSDDKSDEYDLKKFYDDNKTIFTGKYSLENVEYVFSTMPEDIKEQYRISKGISKIKYDYSQPSYNQSDNDDLARKMRNSALLDTIWSVLTNPSTAPKLLNPGGFDNQKSSTYKDRILENAPLDMLTDDYIQKVLATSDLKALKKEYKKYKSTDSPLSPIVWAVNRNRMVSSGKMIGLYANQGSNHALMQHTNLAIKSEFNWNIDGNKNNSLHEIYNHKGHIISKNVSERIDSAVDDVKDPTLSDTNQNLFTGDAVALMSRKGDESDPVVFLMKQPIVVEMAQMFMSKEGRFKDKRVVIENTIENWRKRLNDPSDAPTQYSSTTEFTTFELAKNIVNARKLAEGQTPSKTVETTRTTNAIQSKQLDINSISSKTEAFNVEVSSDSKDFWTKINNNWQAQHPNGIVAYRKYGDKPQTFSPATVNSGWIGNPFSTYQRGATTVQQFYDWLTTGNNFGNSRATEEFRKAIIEKILETPEKSPILYYKELGRPSHATVIGYLITNKYLLQQTQQKESYPIQVPNNIDEYQAYVVNQIKAGLLFQNIFEVANDLSDVVRYGRADTANGAAGPDIASTNNKITSAKYIVEHSGKNDSKDYTLEGTDGLVQLNLLFDKNGDKIDMSKGSPAANELRKAFWASPVPITQAMFTLGIEGSRYLWGDYMPYYKEAFTNVVDMICGLTKTGKITVKLENKIYRDALLYLMSGTDMYRTYRDYSGNVYTVGKPHPTDEDRHTVTPAEILTLWVTDFPKKAAEFLKDNKLEGNEFAKRIFRKKPTNNCPISTVVFRNVGDLNNQSKWIIGNFWNDMLIHGTEKQQEFARDLFVYSGLRNSFDFGPKTFIHLANTELRLAMEDYISTLRTMEQSPNLDLKDYSEMWVYNHLEERAISPEIEANAMGIESATNMPLAIEIPTNPPLMIIKRRSREGNIYHDFITIKDANGQDTYYKLDIENSRPTYRRIYRLGVKNEILLYSKDYSANELSEKVNLAEAERYFYKREFKAFGNHTNVSVNTTNYTKSTATNNPNTDYVFTENAHAYEQTRHPGIYNFDYNTEVNVNGSSAIIRTDKNGTFNTNAYGLVVKKFWQDRNGNTVHQEGTFKDTEEDFQLFKDYFENFKEQLSASENTRLVLPKEIALGRAALPHRFVEYLAEQLKELTGAVYTIEKNQDKRYDGYGLRFKDFVKIDQLTKQDFTYANIEGDRDFNVSKDSPFWDYNAEMKFDGIRTNIGRFITTLAKNDKFKSISVLKAVYRELWNAWALTNKDLILKLKSELAKTNQTLYSPGITVNVNGKDITFNNASVLASIIANTSADESNTPEDEDTDALDITNGQTLPLITTREGLSTMLYSVKEGTENSKDPTCL